METNTVVGLGNTAQASGRVLTENANMILLLRDLLNELLQIIFLRDVARPKPAFPSKESATLCSNQWHGTLRGLDDYAYGIISPPCLGL
jgi:hypothetical protein